MTNDELDKRIEWIVEQRAQFHTDLEIMREIQAADTKRLQQQQDKLSEAMIGVLAMIGQLTVAQERTDARVAELAAAQTRTESVVAEMGERLNVFINVVERYIGGNGNKPATDPS